MRIVFIICAAIAMTACAGTGRKAAITPDELSIIAGRLASEQFSGRGTGTAGDSLAALYIRDELKKAGARPFAGNGLQPFSVNVAVEPGSNNRMAVNGREYLAGTDFMPLALSANASLAAPVVFCGYGLLPSGDTLHRDDFSGLDLPGKWALVLRGYPESDPAAAGYGRLSSDRIKVLNAREKGASGGTACIRREVGSG